VGTARRPVLTPSSRADRTCAFLPSPCSIRLPLLSFGRPRRRRVRAGARGMARPAHERAGGRCDEIAESWRLRMVGAARVAPRRSERAGLPGSHPPEDRCHGSRNLGTRTDPSPAGRRTGRRCVPSQCCAEWRRLTPGISRRPGGVADPSILPPPRRTHSLSIASRCLAIETNRNISRYDKADKVHLGDHTLSAS
jgi:hypothetical protein